MRDVLGKEIGLGDRILYARRRGSQLWLQEATVTEARMGSPDIQVQPVDAPRRQRLRVEGYIVIIEKAKSFQEQMAEAWAEPNPLAPQTEESPNGDQVQG